MTLTLDWGQRRFIVETYDQGLATVDLATMPGTLEVPQPRTSLISSSATAVRQRHPGERGQLPLQPAPGALAWPRGFRRSEPGRDAFPGDVILTAGLQMPTARFVAIYGADRNLGGMADLRRWATRMAGRLGDRFAGRVCAGRAALWSNFFSTASPLPFVIFGLFVPFYLVQGVDRGVLQGRTRFRWLAITYQTEMWSRLVLSLAFVAVGWAVNGAVLGIGLSFVAAWLVARRVSSRPASPRDRLRPRSAARCWSLSARCWSPNWARSSSTTAMS